MTFMDRVAEEIGVLSESVLWVRENGAHRAGKVRRPGKSGSQAPTDLDVLAWLMEVEAAVWEWSVETDRVLSVTPVWGDVPVLLGGLAFKVKVVAVKQGVAPTWIPDMFRLSRIGRQMTGRSARFVRIGESCPVCGGELVADPDRWVLVCLNPGCRDEGGRKTTIRIDVPVGVAVVGTPGVRSDETQGVGPTPAQETPCDTSD